MSALESAAALFGPLVELLRPLVERALSQGVTPEQITAALVDTAARTAVARVEHRAGHAVNPLLVEVVHLGDRAVALRSLGREADARTVEGIAASLTRAVREDDDTARHDVPTSER